MRKSGFTLIELLVVISIIVLLSSIVLASLSTARARARDTRRIEDLRQIQTALELYFSDYGKYPEPARGYGFWSGHCEGDFGNFDEYIIGLAPDYIFVLPRDPKYIHQNFRNRNVTHIFPLKQNICFLSAMPWKRSAQTLPTYQILI